MIFDFIMDIFFVDYPTGDGIDFLSGFFFSITIVVLISSFKKIKSKYFS